MKDFFANLLSPAILVAAVILFCSLQGCGGSDAGPERASVSGKLTIKGKPVPGVEVNFLNPEYPNYGSYAVTDSEGNFQLKVGAVPGENKIFFSKLQSGEIELNPDEGMDSGQLEAMAASAPKRKKDKPEQLIPAEYADASSTLTFVVPENGTDEANFDI